MVKRLQHAIKNSHTIDKNCLRLVKPVIEYSKLNAIETLKIILKFDPVPYRRLFHVINFQKYCH